MQLKTLKDLKNLLDENDGEIRIGKLVIRYDADKTNIDFADGTKYYAWINSDNFVKDDKELSELSISFDPSFENRESTNQELINTQTKNKELQNAQVSIKSEVEKLQNEFENKHSSDFQNLNKNIGMVEAYEKILLNRKITIE